MEGILSYGFLQRALIAGAFISVSCGILGVFLILRRDAMLAHGFAHITFAGVALGLFLNLMPTGVALIIAVLASLGIMRLKEKTGLHGDTAIGIVSSVGLAVGIILVSLSQDFNADLFSFFFGEILAVEVSEVWFAVGLTAVILLVVTVFYRKFIYMTFDPEAAKASGIKVKELDAILTVLTAVTIVLGMKVVGLLLVSALVVIPAASSLQVAGSFKKALVFSSLISLLSVTASLFLAFFLDLPVSGTIVVLNFFVFMGILAAKRIIKTY